MNDTHPILAAILDNIADQPAQLARAAAKAGPRRFAPQPHSAFGALPEPEQEPARVRTQGAVEWIDVRDEYPEPEATVLLSISGGHEPVWLGYSDGKVWFEMPFDPVRGTVTHWARLPMGMVL